MSTVTPALGLSIGGASVVTGMPPDIGLSPLVPADDPATMWEHPLMAKGIMEFCGAHAKAGDVPVAVEN